jgi:hypothetical protein
VSRLPQEIVAGFANSAHHQRDLAQDAPISGRCTASFNAPFRTRLAPPHNLAPPVCRVALGTIWPSAAVNIIALVAVDAGTRLGLAHLAQRHGMTRRALDLEMLTCQGETRFEIAVTELLRLSLYFKRSNLIGERTRRSATEPHGLRPGPRLQLRINGFHIGRPINGYGWRALHAALP